MSPPDSDRLRWCFTFTPEGETATVCGQVLTTMLGVCGLCEPSPPSPHHPTPCPFRILRPQTVWDACSPLPVGRHDACS